MEMTNTMADGRLKNSIRNTISGITSRVITIFFPFIIRTVIIKKIGMEYAGLNGLFSSVLMMLSISELGFGSALIYSMYKPIAEADDDKVCALLNFYKKVYRIIGCIILIFGLILLPFVRSFINGDVPSDINVYVLYLVFLLNTVIGYFAFAYKSSLLTASQRSDISNRISICVSLAMYAAQLTVLWFLKNYMAYVILSPVFTVITNIVQSFVVDKVYPQYRCRGSLEKGEIKEIYKNVFALFGEKVGWTVLLSTDTIVISSTLGLMAVACYNNYYMIISAVRNLVMVIFDSIRPSVGNSMVTESLEKNYKDFNKITSLFIWISGFCSISMICLFQPFMRVWVGEEYLLSKATVVMFGVYFFGWKMLDVLVLYQDAAGLWWYSKSRPYVVSILNILGDILLVHIFGLDGVVFATLFTSVCMSYPWLLRVLFKRYFKNTPWDYLKRLSLQCLVVAAAALLTYLLCYHVIIGYSFAKFVIRTAICAVIPNFIFLFTIGKKSGVHEIISKVTNGRI